LHDDLLDVAARRARGWLVVVGVVAAIGPGVLVAVLGGVLAGIVATTAAAMVIVAWLLAGAPGVGRVPWPRAGLAPAGTEVAGIAAGISLATGMPEPRAFEVAHAAPNVGGFVDRSGDVLLVTDGARALLNRDQLEAVCAAQLAIAHDSASRRLAGAVAAIRWARAFGFLALVSLGLTIPLVPPLGVAALATIPGTVAAWLCGGRVRWWARVAADGVCVRTTRHPEPLVAALRLLARWSGDQVPVGLLTQITGAGGAQWAIEIGPKWTSQMKVNGRLVDTRTAAMVDDTRLLVRAGLVRRVCLDGGEASLLSYRDIAAAVRSAGRAAAQGESALIEGELVGLDGVAPAVAAGPPAWHAAAPEGWYLDPFGQSPYRWWDGTGWTERTA
jgi:Zn-dependent protease with chaperone function